MYAHTNMVTQIHSFCTYARAHRYVHVHARTHDAHTHARTQHTHTTHTQHTHTHNTHTHNTQTHTQTHTHTQMLPLQYNIVQYELIPLLQACH